MRPERRGEMAEASTSNGTVANVAPLEDLSPSEELARITVTDGELPVDEAAPAAYAAAKPASEVSQV